MPTELQGKLLLLEVDFTGAGTTFDTIVCLQTFSDSLDVPIERVDTDCGSFASPGNPTEIIEIAAIKDIAPAANTGSYKKVYAAAHAGNKVKVRIQNPVVGSVTLGSQIYKMFDGYFSNVTLEKDTNSPVSWTASLESSGVIDITP